MSRRKLQVGPDGKADVMLLTDPVPRHLSIVNWGANDRPATSWKSADAPMEVLRSPPSMVDINGVSLASIQSFMVETLDAWEAVIAQVLSTPLSAAERGARVRGHTIQAGARAAALAAAIGQKASQATKTYKAVDLSLPEIPTASTLQGELDRRHFSAAVQQASAALIDMTISAMSGEGEGHSSTESILNAFAQAAKLFEEWAVSLPDGVVGISQEAPSETQNAGARHSQADKAKLNQVLTLLTDILGEDDLPTTTENSAMNIEDLKSLAENDPVGFLSIIKTAVKNAKKEGVTDTRKFMWGETGVDPHSVQEVMGPLRDMLNGELLAGLISGAVSGVDVNGAATGDSPQVASTMRSAIGKALAAELESKPEGEVATAIKTAVAGSVAEAIKQVMEQVLTSGSLPNTTQNSGGIMDGFGHDDSVVNEDGTADVSLLMGETPQLNSPVGRR